MIDQDEFAYNPFDCFCKRLVKNEAIDDCREVARRGKREVVFTELSIEEAQQLYYTDLYSPECRIFSVGGLAVPIQDDFLARALLALPLNHMNIVLLAYIIGLSDSEICNYLGLARSTVQYRRSQAIIKLRKLMEVSDEQKIR